MRKLIFLLLLFSICITTYSQKEIRLKYNNPDLVTDLGVGLWGTPIPVDYDGDGLMDIIMNCYDKPFKGLYYFKNIGTASQPLFEKAVKLEDKTYRHMQASYVEGKLYVARPGIIYTDFVPKRYSESISIAPDEMPGKGFGRIRSNMWSYVDYNNSGSLDILVGIDSWGDYGWDNAYNEKGEWTNGPLRGYLYLLKNINGKYFNKGRLQANGQDIETYGAPGSNMADMNGDGKKDIITGDFLDKIKWYKNVGTKTEPRFEEGKYIKNEKGEDIHLHVQMITPVVVDFDFDGHIDIIVGDEDGRVAFIKNTGKKRKGEPVFKDPVYLKQKAEYVKFGALSTPYSVDWDGDGYADIISGNSAGNIAFIKNLNGEENPMWAKPQLLQIAGKDIRIMAGKNGSIQGPAEAKWGYTTLSVADWDGDGKKDLIVNSIFGEIVWYKNTGNLTQLEGPYKVKVDWGNSNNITKPKWNWWQPGSTDLVTQWRTTPIAIDWNKDGLTDLIVVDHEGYLSYYERFEKDGELWLKPGKRIFMALDMNEYDHNNKLISKRGQPLRLNAGEAGKSGRRKICLVDWDNDGDLDLIVNSTNATWFENVKEEDGKVYFVDRGPISEINLAGHDTSPTAVDWNKDGVHDILVGAEDGHFYLIKNNN